MIDNISNMILPNSNKLDENVKKLSNNEKTPERLKEEKALKEACQDFEAIFIHMMLKTGRSTVSEGGLIEKSNGTKMFEDMYDQELAATMSSSGDGGIGIAKMLYEQMKLGLNNRVSNMEVK